MFYSNAQISIINSHDAFTSTIKQSDYFSRSLHEFSKDSDMLNTRWCNWEITSFELESPFEEEK